MNGHTLREKQINNFHFAFPLYVGQLLMERMFLLFFPLEVDPLERQIFVLIKSDNTVILYISVTNISIKEIAELA